MTAPIPRAELADRMQRFRARMDAAKPLVAGMVLALEPKRGVPGVGMVGTENTYVVTASGGRSLTGACPGPILVSA